MDYDNVPTRLSNIVKEKAARMIATGLSQAETARQLEKSRPTVHGWCQESDFKLRVKFLQENIDVQVKEVLAANKEEAAKVIVDIARNGGESGVVSSQLKAAIYILEHADEMGGKNNNKPDAGDEGYNPALEEMDDDGVQELVERMNN